MRRQTASLARLRPALVALLALLAVLSGCERGAFTASGKLSSTGGRLGTWSGTPVSCTRTTFLGPVFSPGGLKRPAGSAQQTLLTFAWEDPTHYDPLRDVHMEKAGDAPMHLGLATRLGADRTEHIWASLDTLKHGMGLRMDETKCRVLKLERTEKPSQVQGGRSVLEGRLTLDCTAHGNHVQGDIAFSNCGY